MSREMEDRLRAAYQAKAEQVTDRRLAQLRAERDSQLATLLSEDIPLVRLEHPPVPLNSRRNRHSRWFAPAVAAAAVAAVAAAALALSAPGPHRATPAPPASRVSSPTASASPSATASPTATASTTGNAGPGYLPAGQTGARDDVPWSAVGTGWRLVQPSDANGLTPELYLYDPAGGRYLISDQLPAQAQLVAWSPDGQRAMLMTYGDEHEYRQVDLHSGQVPAGIPPSVGSFVSYTQPRGLAVVIATQLQGTPRLVRYTADGSLQLVYPAKVDGLQLFGGTALYTADGSQFVTLAGNYSVLMSNGGQLVRQYALPGPEDQLCVPIKWWTSDSFLETCGHPVTGASPDALYLQPVAGGAPTLLIKPEAGSGQTYDDAWQLSNGDVVLSRPAGCGVSHYDVLHPDGTVVPFVWPAGITDPAKIITMSGDLATFRVLKVGSGCGGSGPENALIDYDMVTGTTSTLLHGDGNVVGYPGDN